MFNYRGPYQMTVQEMAEAARILDPAILIPVHWRESERADVETLRTLVKNGVDVRIPATPPASGSRPTGK